ncbi:hypothetical protein [Flavobacterium tegetincola]|uniref:hypothetical protein n=1 Tax=Flavobacterium tegetincola TaxID=150172 RepID=UPI0012FAFC43|nr:hypothetical protein [Flavobacterium tegetincola]
MIISVKKLQKWLLTCKANLKLNCIAQIENSWTGKGENITENEITTFSKIYQEASKFEL